MGFKKENHTIDTLGMTLPKAYAALRTLTMNGDYVVAEFAIQSTRELAINPDIRPLDVITVRFTHARGADIVTEAYQNAKTFKVKYARDFELTVEPFKGWEDDIVEV